MAKGGKKPVTLLDELEKGADEVAKFLAETGATTYHRPDGLGGKIFAGQPRKRRALTTTPFRQLGSLL